MEFCCLNLGVERNLKGTSHPHLQLLVKKDIGL